MQRNSVIRIALALALGLAACGGKHIDPNAPTIEQRIARANLIVMAANDAIAPTITSLADAGAIPPAAMRQIAAYQATVATATRGIAAILAGPGPWQDKAVRVQNLALSLIPPEGVAKLGLDERQYGAVIIALNSIEAAARILVEVTR